jgi:hypothetical protein
VVYDSQQVTAEPEKALEMPEKFANADNPQQELLKAYTELQKRMSSGEKPAAEPAAEPEADTEVKPTEEAPAPEDNYIVDYQNKWAENGGKLEDSDWQALSERSGIPLATLRAYEEGQKALGAQAISDNDSNIYKLSGGEDKYNEMIDWATNGGLTDAQVDSINAQLDNPLFAAQGVAALRGMYQQANGYEPSVTMGDKATSDYIGADEFQSEAEFYSAMSDPKYKSGDPAYHREFQAKAMRYMKRTGQLK